MDMQRFLQGHLLTTVNVPYLSAVRLSVRSQQVQALLVKGVVPGIKAALAHNS